MVFFFTDFSRGNADSIDHPVVRLPSAALEKMGKCGSEYYAHNLSLAAGATKFLGLFNAVILPAPGST